MRLSILTNIRSKYCLQFIKKKKEKVRNFIGLMSSSFCFIYAYTYMQRERINGGRKKGREGERGKRHILFKNFVTHLPVYRFLYVHVHACRFIAFVCRNLKILSTTKTNKKKEIYFAFAYCPQTTNNI